MVYISLHTCAPEELLLEESVSGAANYARVSTSEPLEEGAITFTYYGEMIYLSGLEFHDPVHAFLEQENIA